MMKEYRSNASSKVYGNSVPRASHSYSASAVTESENLSDTLKGGNIK